MLTKMKSTLTLAGVVTLMQRLMFKCKFLGRLFFIVMSALMISSCGQDVPICKEDVPICKEHVLMLEVNSFSRGLVCSDDDYFAGSSWEIYYDGQIAFKNEYNITGETDQLKWTLEDTDLDELYHILRGDFYKYEHDYESACDGVGWNFTFYDENGEVYHEFVGYIYSHDTLNDIVELIEPENIKYLE